VAPDSLHEVVAVNWGIAERISVLRCCSHYEMLGVMRETRAAVCGVEEFRLGRSEPGALKRLVLEPLLFP